MYVLIQIAEANFDARMYILSKTFKLFSFDVLNKLTLVIKFMAKLKFLFLLVTTSNILLLYDFSWNSIL